MKGLCGGQYRPLTEGEIKTIHETSARLLADPGIRVNNRQALEIFAARGTKVDFATQIVRIPRSLLEEAIARAPSRVVLCGRDEEHDLSLEGTRTYLGTGGTVLNVLDLETERRRPATLEDLKNLACLTDALENVHFYMLPVYPTELDPPEVDVNRFWGALTNTAKHVMGGVYSLQGVRDVIGIAAEISGGREQLRERPIISMVTCVMSPLVMEGTYTDLLIEVARQGIPLVCPAEPMAGATAPCTLAATVALSNAETLGGVVLAQLVNPGTPVIYGTVATAMDMKTGSYLSGNIESGLINAASAQMAQFYRLPIYATAGMSDSKIPDIQAGYEKAATALLAALAGANFIHDAAGFLEFCTTISYTQMVIDNEIIGMCMRAVRGIEVNKETLAEEVIRRVSPGGNFLTEEHTLKHFKSEFFYPRISDRQNRKLWEKQGAKDAAGRARERAAKLLAEHQPLPVPPETVARVRALYPVLK